MAKRLLVSFNQRNAHSFPEHLDDSHSLARRLRSGASQRQDDPFTRRHEKLFLSSAVAGQIKDRLLVAESGERDQPASQGRQ